MSQKLERDREKCKGKHKWAASVGYIVAGILGAAILMITVVLALVLRDAPPPIIHTDQAAGLRLQREVQQAQASAAIGMPGVVRASETELNSVLNEYLKATAGKPLANDAAFLRDLKVNLDADRLRLYVLANFRGKDLTFVLEGKVRTVGGYLDFDPISAKIGSLSIPRESLKKALAQMAAAPQTQELMRLPRNLSDLHVENGQIVVTFK